MLAADFRARTGMVVLKGGQSACPNALGQLRCAITYGRSDDEHRDRLVRGTSPINGSALR